MGINYSLAIDGISALLVLLTTLLTVVCIGASFRIDRKVKNYMAFMLLLEGGLIGVFLATNLFLFYIFWEVMLIPAYFLVGAWGGERRIYAAFKFVLYTSVGSFLMLAAIIALGYFHQQANGGGYTLDLITLLNGKLDSGVQIWLLLGFAAAFAVKVPLVPFHSWLPDAYTEAPAPVTAMLAGAMAKAGAYGFLRFCIPLFPSAIQTLAPLFRILAVIGILYCAWQALTQTDLKRILAYSSISHLGVIILAMFAFNTKGVEGSVMQMVNHGITIAALFLLVGFLEERTGTRRIGDFGWYRDPHPYPGNNYAYCLALLTWIARIEQFRGRISGSAWNIPQQCYLRCAGHNRCCTCCMVYDPLFPGCDGGTTQDRRPCRSAFA